MSDIRGGVRHRVGETITSTASGRGPAARAMDATNGTLCGPTIHDMPNPVDPGDPATKQYVDNIAVPIKLHAPVNLATNGSAAFTGSISGTTLTVSTVASGKIGPNQFITGTGVAPGTSITS